ncbi:hypothetical protein [Burkholderia cenocepacia]|uniref:hypothetical protein n=1 Tax=Burkholderia cenocepacia TaxID=95486 RepID=UPI0020110BC5|nr:hypothetical protein [Burkholderia cenocepacia]
MIADPATALDPMIKPTGSLIYPMPDAKTIGDWITAIIPDRVKNLVDYVFTMASGKGGNSSFWSSIKDKSPLKTPTAIRPIMVENFRTIRTRCSMFRRHRTS